MLTRHRLLVCHALVLLRSFPPFCRPLFAESFSRASLGYRRNSPPADMQARASLRAPWLSVKGVYVYRHCSRPRTCNRGRGGETSYELVVLSCSTPLQSLRRRRYRYARIDAYFPLLETVHPNSIATKCQSRQLCWFVRDVYRSSGKYVRDVFERWWRGRHFVGGDRSKRAKKILTRNGEKSFSL